MVRKATFIGGRHNGHIEELEWVRNIERSGDTYTSVNIPQSSEFVIFVLSGAINSYTDILARELYETKDLCRRLYRETESINSVA